MSTSKSSSDQRDVANPLALYLAAVHDGQRRPAIDLAADGLAADGALRWVQTTGQPISRWGRTS